MTSTTPNCPADARVIVTITDTVRRLRDSLADVEFGLAMVPERWHHERSPEVAPDAWTVAMNLAHLTFYEENVALRLLRSFAPGFDPAHSRIASSHEITGWTAMATPVTPRTADPARRRRCMHARARCCD